MGFSVWAAETHFDATVDHNQVGLGDQVTLQLTLTTDSNLNEDGEPRLPTLDGFELMNKWTQSQSRSIFENGQFKFERKLIYNYTLAPQKKGKLTIGQAEIRVNGQTLKSSPIKIDVLDTGAVPKSKVAKNPGQDDDSFGPFGDDDENDLFTQLLRRRGLGPRQRGGRPNQNQPGGQAPPQSAPDVNSKDAFFISVELSKKKAYVGEEIIATWYLYTRGALQGFDALKYPDLKGFWKEDLDMATRLNFQQEIVNGIPYNRALLVSYALFPISAGQKIVDSYQAKGTVIQMDSPMAMFGLGQPINITKNSKEIPVEVIPLPTEGRPASFSGGVGHFAITGNLSATQVKANQPVSLKIRFTGEGNVKAIELPQLDLPKNLELYDTKKESKFQKSGEGYKEFELLIVPRIEGDVTIPAIPLSYFDPKTSKYVTASTPAFSLKVLPGNPGSAPPPVSAAKEVEKPKAAASDINYLKTMPTLALPPAEEKILWLVAFLTVYLIFGFQIWKALFGRGGDVSAEIRKRVKKKLEAARQFLKKGDWRSVGVECSNAVLSTLGEVAGGGGATLSEELLSRLPDEEKKLKENIGKFLSRCEIISFAPKELAGVRENSELKKIIGEAEKLIQALLEIAKKEKVKAQAPVQNEVSV